MHGQTDPERIAAWFSFLSMVSSLIYKHSKLQIMRIKPLKPETLNKEQRFVHDEITKLIGHSQSPVKMTDRDGSLVGPFPPMLQYPQFGIPALTFIRSLDNHATLDKALREVVILTVGGAMGARFELYAHEIMAEAFGLSPAFISTLASGGTPQGLSETKAIAHEIARILVSGRIVPDSTYKLAVDLLGESGVAELFFLVGSYSLIAMILNGFDIQAPNN
jgi:4-carboxymuconolactone decarboxylase